MWTGPIENAEHLYGACGHCRVIKAFSHSPLCDRCSDKMLADELAPKRKPWYLKVVRKVVRWLVKGGIV